MISNKEGEASLYSIIVGGTFTTKEWMPLA